MEFKCCFAIVVFYLFIVCLIEMLFMTIVMCNTTRDYEQALPLAAIAKLDRMLLGSGLL